MESYPLSPMQQGMLFHYLSDPHSGVDIEQMVCELHEELNVKAFQQAWQKIVTLHPTLRTSFRWKTVDVPIQDVHVNVTVPFITHDWQSLSEAECKSKFKEFLKADRQRGFDLSKAPLIRLTLFQIEKAEFRLVWTFHHIVADGRSHQIIINDIFMIYNALRQGKSIQTKQSHSYHSYIDWLLQQDFSSSKTFWQNTLQGFTAATPVDTSQTNERKIENEIEHPVLEICLSRDVTSSLSKIAKDNQVTLNTLVQGSWALLLSRTTGDEDIVFGATRACRKVPVDGIEDMVGLFINTLPVRVRVTPNDYLNPWIKELREQHIAIREHEHTPLTQVKSWSDIPSGKPLFESIVIFDNYELNARFQSQGEEWKSRKFRLFEKTGFPLSLYAYGDSELSLKLLYDPALFNRTTIKRMLGHLKTILEEISTESNPRLVSLPIITEAERHQILVEWNNTQKDFQRDSCIHQQFEAQAERTPNKIAVVFKDRKLTYNKLNCRANQLAHYLQVMGVKPDVKVGIYMERSLEMIVGLLGILKAGGAYVPLDPTYPKERIDFMIEDSEAAIILTQKRLSKTLFKNKSKVICLDTEQHLLSDKPLENTDTGVKGENLAYVIYTSGSTGQPKGVMLEHRNVINFFVGMDAEIDHEPPGTWLAITSISFDISVLELFWTLARGFTVVLLDTMSAPSSIISVNNGEEQNHSLADFIRNDDSLSTLIHKNSITHFQCTPSTARLLMLMEDTRQALGLIKNIIIGGEVFPVALAKQIRSITPGKLLNLYGPTETTVWSSAEHVEDIGNSVSIGRPIANTEFYILDRNLQPLPVGIPGELYIGGEGVARGYMNNRKLTEENFIPNPFNEIKSDRLYRTGDLVRYLPDGRVEFLGRLDHQVKLRGYRIELGEIETTLEYHPSVQEAIVIAREDIPGKKQLVAYMTVQLDSTPLMSELRSFLRKKLPEYMVPAIFVFLREFPLTPNGKVNRKALPIPESARSILKKDYIAPRSSTEKELANLWCGVLGFKKISLHDNFFDLGGQYNWVVRITDQINEKFKINITPKRFTTAQTLADLALKVDLAKIEKTLKDLPFPTRFAVEVNADCNMECIMCHHPQMKRPKGKMPFELWKRCADQIAESSPDTQCWFSFCGEPLLEPDLLIRMIKYGKSIGLRSLNINTNGMMLTSDLADPIIDSGVDLVVFGIDGFTKETFERIRVKGDRDELYKNVESFLAARDSHPDGPEVQVQFIEIDQNADELDLFKKYWLDRGVIVKYRRMLSWGGTFETSLDIPNEERIPCPWALTMMHVFWDGRIPRCPGDIEGEEAVGNAWDEPLIDLWDKLRTYRENHLNHNWDELPKRCLVCKDWMTGSAERVHPDKIK